METINKVMGAAGRAIWGAGESNQEQKQHGEEPLSGVTGKGTGTDPYDAGNRDVQPDAPSTQEGGTPVPTYGVDRSNQQSSSGNSNSNSSSNPGGSSSSNSSPSSEQPQTPYLSTKSRLGSNPGSSESQQQINPEQGDQGTCSEPLAQHSSSGQDGTSGGSDSYSESMQQAQQEQQPDPERGDQGVCSQPLAQHSTGGQAVGSSDHMSGPTEQTEENLGQQQENPVLATGPQSQSQSQSQSQNESQNSGGGSSSQSQSSGQNQSQGQNSNQNQNQNLSQEPTQGQGQQSDGSEVQPRTSEEARKGPQGPPPPKPPEEDLPNSAGGKDVRVPIREDIPAGGSKPGRTDEQGGQPGGPFSKLKDKLHLSGKTKAIGSSPSRLGL